MPGTPFSARPPRSAVCLKIRNEAGLELPSKTSQYNFSVSVPAAVGLDQILDFREKGSSLVQPETDSLA